EAAMRMVRKPTDIVPRIVGAERVEHQKRIEPSLQWLRQYARELHPGAIRGRLARDQPLDRPRPRHRLDSGFCERRRHCILLVDQVSILAACRKIRTLPGVATRLLL